MAEGEGGIAIFLVEKTAGALVGQAATQFIGTPIFKALGVGPADNSAAYFSQVRDAIEALGDRLRQQIGALQTGIDNVAALSIQISAYQQVEGLSNVLQKFNEAATVIDTIFSQFQSDVSFLSADPDKNAAAIKDMYVRLTAPNDTNIAVAMGNIHNLVVPTAGTRGIFDHLCDVVANRVFAGGQAAMATPASNPPGDWRKDWCLPQDMQYYEAKAIETQAPDAVAAEMATAVTVIRSILSAQLKGLFLLGKAWTGGPQERNLKIYTKKLLDEIAAMKAFYPACCDAVDGAISRALQQFGKPLSGTITTIEGMSGAIPDFKDFIVWEVSHDPYRGNHSIDSALIVDRPWIRSSGRPAKLVFMGGNRDIPEPTFLYANDRPKWHSQTVWGVMGQPETLPHFNAPAPAALTALLDALPKSEDELQQQQAAHITWLANGKGQDNWRCCARCASLYYESAVSRCPAGGTHRQDASNFDYAVQFSGSSVPAAVQDGWRWCNKCGVLHYDGAPSACPAGGRHGSDGSGKYRLAVGKALSEDTASKRNWRWCDRCGVLHLADNVGVCAGNFSKPHDTKGSGDYVLSYFADRS